LKYPKRPKPWGWCDTIEQVRFWHCRDYVVYSDEEIETILKEKVNPAIHDEARKLLREVSEFNKKRLEKIERGEIGFIID